MRWTVKPEPLAPYIVIAGPGSQRIVGGTYSFDYAAAARLAGRFPPAIVVNADWYRRNYNRDPLAGLTCPDPPKAKEGRPPGSNTQKNPATETGVQKRCCFFGAGRFCPVVSSDFQRTKPL